MRREKLIRRRARDVPVVQSGGKADFQYNSKPEWLYPPTKVDRVLHDKGKTYDVVIIGSPNVNPGYKLVGNELYPKIAEDYERMFRVLSALPCDLFLGAHGGYFGMEDKVPKKKMKAGRPALSSIRRATRNS